MNTEVKKKIESFIAENPVFLFMKGTKSFPMCGFSAQTVTILQNLKVPFESFNVLDDETIRSGIKEYGDWPTIPQLYVNKKLIGGCDIVTEMYESGELAELFKNELE